MPSRGHRWFESFVKLVKVQTSTETGLFLLATKTTMSATVSFSPDNLNINDCVLMTNGYIGIVKHINENQDQFGVDLFDKHPNGHNGDSLFDTQQPGHALFVAQSDIVTKLKYINITANNDSPKISDYTLNINNNQDVIYFPTYSELHKIQNEQQILIASGYSRNTQKHVPCDIILSIVHYHYLLTIGDLVKLKDGNVGTISCIGRSIINKKLHYGIKIIQDIGQNELNYTFKTRQEISKILSNDEGLVIGSKITCFGKRASIKYIGKVYDIPELIGIEFSNMNDDKPLNGHNGKGFFSCSTQHIDNNYGLFVHRNKCSIFVHLQGNINDLDKFVKGCYSDHPAAQFESTQRIRKLLSIERDPPIDNVIETGAIFRIFPYISISTQHEQY